MQLLRAGSLSLGLSAPKFGETVAGAGERAIRFQRRTRCHIRPVRLSGRLTIGLVLKSDFQTCPGDGARWLLAGISVTTSATAPWCNFENEENRRVWLSDLAQTARMARCCIAKKHETAQCTGRHGEVLMGKRFAQRFLLHQSISTLRLITAEGRQSYSLRCRTLPE